MSGALLDGFCLILLKIRSFLTDSSPPWLKSNTRRRKKVKLLTEGCTEDPTNTRIKAEFRLLDRLIDLICNIRSQKLPSAPRVCLSVWSGSGISPNYSPWIRTTETRVHLSGSPLGLPPGSHSPPFLASFFIYLFLNLFVTSVRWMWMEARGMTAWRGRSQTSAGEKLTWGSEWSKAALSCGTALNHTELYYNLTI